RTSTDEIDLFPFAVEKDGWFHRIIPIYIFMKGDERMGSPSGLEDGNLGEGG
ncbi:unnamed protein product, partial [Musa acuminata var. zebrina]